MKTVYLSLGSNIGDRLANLQRAVDLLASNGVKVLAVSNVYETEPVGYKDQPDFLNIALKAQTELGPYELLKLCANVESALLRRRGIRFGPRTIDVDILLYEDFVSDDPALTVPHPRMYERAFVLVPLIEVIDGEQLIIAKKALEKTGRSGVRLFGKF